MQHLFKTGGNGKQFKWPVVKCIMYTSSTPWNIIWYKKKYLHENTCFPSTHTKKKHTVRKKKKNLLGSLKSLPLDHNTHNPSLWSHLLGLSTPLIHRKAQHQSFCPATPMIIPEDFNSNIFSQVLHFLQINLFFHPISVTSSHNHTPNCHVQ